jgi:AbrB family looped-hinge helix DNA binding protein
VVGGEQRAKSEEEEAHGAKNGLENGAANGKVVAMTATLDKAGRVVLPKKIREKLHLKTGAAFKIEIVGDKIELEQELPKVRIVRNARGRRVVMGWEGFDAAKAVQENREERMENLMPAKRR